MGYYRARELSVQKTDSEQHFVGFVLHTALNKRISGN